MCVCHLKQGSVLIPALQVNILMAELGWFLLYIDKAVFFSSQWAIDGKRQGMLSHFRGATLETRYSLTLPAQKEMTGNWKTLL